MRILLILASTFLSSLLLAELMKKVALRFDIVDKPNTDLKTHKKATPYLGGGAVLGSVFVGLTTGFFYYDLDVASMLPMVLMFVVIAGLGLVDDIRNLSWKIRIIVQFLVGICTYYTGFALNVSSTPLLNVLITAFWISAIINSINIIDIMDGLSSGVAGASGLGFGVLGMVNGIHMLTVLGFTLFGASIGFLIHNFRPASIFLGDMGSTLVGLILAYLGIIIARSHDASLSGLLIALLLLYVPLFDLVFVSIIRIANGKSPFKGSPDHFAIRLRNSGISVEGTVSIAYSVQLMFVFLAIILNSRPEVSIPVVLGVMIMSVMFGSGLIYLPKIKRHGLSQRILSEAAVTKDEQ
jgi:UDP-GlcNAc:undecaprenyl-phosphate GlcNAc-1-phosphate transferase